MRILCLTNWRCIGTSKLLVYFSKEHNRCWSLVFLILQVCSPSLVSFLFKQGNTTDFCKETINEKRRKDGGVAPKCHCRIAHHSNADPRQNFSAIVRVARVAASNMVRSTHFIDLKYKNLRPQPWADPLGVFAVTVLCSERTLLLVSNDFNGKTYDPQSKADAVYEVPSGRSFSNKVTHVNGHCCDKHPHSLNVPESKESEFVVSYKIEAIVLSSLPNVMQNTGNKKHAGEQTSAIFRSDLLEWCGKKEMSRA